MDKYNEALDKICADLRNRMGEDMPKDPNSYIVRLLEQHQYTVPDPPRCDSIENVGKNTKIPLTIIVFGASGDLATKKIFPSLFNLFTGGYLPGKYERGTLKDISALLILGVARHKYTQDDFHKCIKEKLLQSATKSQIKCHIDMFLTKYVRYFSLEEYDSKEGLISLRSVIKTHEGRIPVPCTEEDFQRCSLGELLKGRSDVKKGNRLYFMALPPKVFLITASVVRTSLEDPEVQNQLPQEEEAHDIKDDEDEKPFTRIIIEKPFGHDIASSRALVTSISKFFTEEQQYRIDHYLGKEMVQNLIATRFSNHIFSTLWSRNHVEAVLIHLNEQLLVDGRIGYFDSHGIIRDVVQNHLTQVLALTAMEKPKKLTAQSILEEKIELLRLIKPIAAEDIILGRYIRSADEKVKGYMELEGVPQDSKCVTYAMVRLSIENDRWTGVPFILTAGKALSKKEVIIRIVFRNELRPFSNVYPLLDEGKAGYITQSNNNELILRAQPREAIFLRINMKKPGMVVQSDGRSEKDNNCPLCSVITNELSLTYSYRYSEYIPDAYESLLYEALRGDHTNFVQSEELDLAWRIYTPILKQIDEGKVKIHDYPAGSAGPDEAVKYLKNFDVKNSGHFGEMSHLQDNVAL